MHWGPRSSDLIAQAAPSRQYAPHPKEVNGFGIGVVEVKLQTM